jgi:lysozyme
MDLETELRAHLEWAEGRRSKPYRDTVGKLTIGCGRNLDDVGLRDDEIDYLLGRDIESVLSTCSTLPYWTALDDVRRLVVCDLVFNLGAPGWRKFAKANAAITRGDYAAAAAELVSSKWYGQVGRRGKKLADAMRSGTWTRSP